ncbi:hypothetical protein E2C01_072661 [Portunus trituberculatus]|uniref:Uncharacterized protein n=1 Tax=Portunus trituberculatus TaxID=210409 RepID=A0A5B7I8G0_PORTR|nr:hypothetical protein [Portunus trituberculatus]
MADLRGVSATLATLEPSFTLQDKKCLSVKLIPLHPSADSGTAVTDWHAVTHHGQSNIVTVAHILLLSHWLACTQ